MNAAPKNDKRARQLCTVLLLTAAAIVILLSAGSARAAPRRITFSDGSRSCLQYSENHWVLKDRYGKRLTGLQYVSIKKSYGLTSGYYVFDEEGCLIQKRAVYKFTRQKIHNIYFDGYYYTASRTGKLCYDAAGLVYLENTHCEGITFDGVYYVGRMGKLDTPASTVRYLKRTVVKGSAIPAGYYCFTPYGRLLRNAGFHTLQKQTVKKITFSGSYYFCPGGALCRKEGPVVWNGKKYYVGAQGEKLVNSWRNGFYYQADGSMAISRQVPDGTWVGDDGRKISSAQQKLYPLRNQLSSMISDYKGEWSVYVKDLKTGDILSINDTSMYAASIIKAFALAYTYELIAAGKLEKTEEVKKLLNRMITISDNTSFNKLVALWYEGDFLKGAEELNDYLKKNGYAKTSLHHSVGPASNAYVTDGGSNEACTKDCALLLERIETGSCVNRAASKEMKDLLLKQQRTWKIPAVLPSTAVVANKTGETNAVQHDIAIVSGPETTYIICVFSTTDQNSGVNGIKNISKAVWDQLENRGIEVE